MQLEVLPRGQEALFRPTELAQPPLADLAARPAALETCVAVLVKRAT